MSPAPAPPLPAPNSVGAWILACRPKTLTAALAPVLAGTALAWHSGFVRWAEGTLALVGALLLQILSNLANDVFDFEKGADTDERLGPLRAVQAGLVSPQAMKRAIYVVVALALAVGAALAWLSGPWVVGVGLVSIASALAYTGGPYPLGYHGWGDVFVFLFFGLVAVLGTVHVHGAPLTPLAWQVACALGALATNILVVNNVRDRQTDQLVGKRTLAVRFGRAASEVQYLGMNAVAFLVPVVAVAFGWANWPALVSLLALPLTLRNWAALKRLEGRALNPLLGATAKVVFAYSALLSLGIVLGHTTFG